MVLFPSFFDGISKKGKKKKKDGGKEAAEAMANDARKKELMLSSSGIVNSNNSHNFASVCSQRGQKGINQDRLLVWEEFGCQEDMIFCGIFDGHGAWGHVVAKRVRESVASSLLCNWQETLAMKSPQIELDDHFDIWKHSYLKTYAAVDLDLKLNPQLGSFSSGTTALTMIKQGDHLVIANVGDSRAVLATASDDDGRLIPIQLTVDFKPNLPQEAERITQSKGRVFCLNDEPGVYRVWMPNGKRPGLALSRAFGDYCVKDFGLISIPDVTHRTITTRDQFVILATDGLWDVISNKEAIEIVSSTPKRKKSAKRLVQCATQAWKDNKRGIAMDDISAICLFFHDSNSPSQQVEKPAK
ncbi:probable protein phosphatase 2C 41 [Euphorbia lathyris]|uniref:probable protein phosphatase 2C 41 n=1 Tax=Euphorbia lathyris TaxID=212925 RepID=UPI003313E6E1